MCRSRIAVLTQSFVRHCTEREGLVRLSEDIASSPLMHEIPSEIQIVFLDAPASLNLKLSVGQ